MSKVLLALTSIFPLIFYENFAGIRQEEESSK
jgi:hypothetical protein